MNKDEFLNELKSYLSILEDEEQADILEEYTQHIDMKISTGLSEAEAIRDFGNVSELAAQILEAYHVKPGYREALPDRTGCGAVAVKPEKASVMDGIADYMDSIAGSIAETFAETGRELKRIWGEIRWGELRKNGTEVLETIWEVLGVPFRWLDRLFTGKKKEIDAEETLAEPEIIQSGKERADQNMFRDLCRSMGNGIAGIFTGIWRLFLWCVKWCWKGIMIAAALFGGICCMLLLFLLAMVLVWLLQGYPLAGAAIVCFGGVLCAGSFTVLCTTFLVRRQTNTGSRRMVKERTQGR